MSDTTVGPDPSGEARPELPTSSDLPTPSDLPAPPAGPDAPRSTRSRVLRAGAVTVAAVLVGVALGVGIVQAEYGDAPKAVAPGAAGPAVASAAPASPAAPSAPAFGARSDGNHFGSLRDLLIPVPAGFVPGPDYSAYGNDTELSAEQSAAELDEGLKGVPADKRGRMREFWNGLHVRGTGIRTFKSSASDLVVNVRLRQFDRGNAQGEQKENEYTAVLTGGAAGNGRLRIGPEIPGHPEAHCYLMPVGPGAPIDYLECSAVEGDLLVVMGVEGVALLPKDKIVSLFTAQLDRLARPGASA